MPKLLYISNVGGQKMTGSFAGTSIDSAHSLGLDYYVVANRSKMTDKQRKVDEEKFKIKICHADISRSPFSFSNIRAYKQIVDLIKQESIDYIHCNTPVGGVLGRLAGKKCKVKRVIYQAHGFHFYKGAPLINWILYYPIEKILAHYTDAMITINHEDYERAKKFHLRNRGIVYYVPGVGINTKNYKPRKHYREEKRKELPVKDGDIVVVSVGDLLERENYHTAIEAIGKLNNEHIHYLVCGDGPIKNDLRQFAIEKGVEKQIHFLGFRSDIKEILWASDIFLCTTYYEEIPSTLVKAMACGIPCIAQKNSCNISLIDKDRTVLLYEPNNLEELTNAINKLAGDASLRKRIGYASIYRVLDLYTDTEKVNINDSFLKGVIDEYIPTWIKKRLEIGIPLDSILIISVGELNDNKNQKIIIQALEEINNTKIHFILCGEGKNKAKLKSMLKKTMENVHFLGYRSDVVDLLRSSDIYVMPSKREGLSRSLMEAMCMGLPCICSDIRGNSDLLQDNSGKELCRTLQDYVDAIREITSSCDEMERIGRKNYEIIKKYDVQLIQSKLEHIYACEFN